MPYQKFNKWITKTHVKQDYLQFHLDYQFFLFYTILIFSLYKNLKYVTFQNKVM